MANKVRLYLGPGQCGGGAAWDRAAEAQPMCACVWGQGGDGGQGLGKGGAGGKGWVGGGGETKASADSRSDSAF